MQKNNWLRLSLASMIVAGIGAGSVLQGCSDDDVTPSADSGVKTDASSTSTVTPTPDASTTTTVTPDAAPPPKSQKIIFVHAANWLGPAFESSTGTASALNGAIRLCLRAGPAGTNPFLPVPALPNKASAPLPIPALLPGTGGVLPATTDFSTTRLEGYAMNAQVLAAKAATLATDAEKTKFFNTACGDLFNKGLDGDAAAPTDGGTNLREGTDYLKVGVIEAGTFATEKTFVVSVQGCAPFYADQAGVTAEIVAAKCGAGYSNQNGNLKLKVQEVSRGAVAATELGAQFIHATTGTATLPINPGVIPGGGTDGGADAAAFKAFSTTAPIAYDTPITAQVKLAGVSLTADGLTVNPAAPVPPYSFASAVAATSPSTPIALGTSHVFVLVGETSALTNDTAPNNRKLHFLTFPADPTVPPLTQ